jgi:hypothetical protein
MKRAIASRDYVSYIVSSKHVASSDVFFGMHDMGMDVSPERLAGTENMFWRGIVGLKTASSS